jgi:valyl-tRNA synthetase
MSKSLGTVIDPLYIIDQYGTDALRYSLISGVTPGNDVKFSESKAEGAKHFCNKIWNATRFVLVQTEVKTEGTGIKPAPTDELPTWKSMTLAQQWIVSKAHQAVSMVTKTIEGYSFSEFSLGMYEFFWHDFCDWYLELAKAELQNEETAGQAKQVLRYVLNVSLRLLHPLMPFITEALWAEVNPSASKIIVTEWPEGGKIDEQALTQFDAIANCINELRSLRAEFHIGLGQKLNAEIVRATPFSSTEEQYISVLGKLAKITQHKSLDTAPSRTLKIVLPDCDIYVHVGESFDFEKEKKRIHDAIKTAESRIASLEKQLSNEAFTQSAPKEIIEERKNSLEEAKNKLDKLNQQSHQLE